MLAGRAAARTYASFLVGADRTLRPKSRKPLTEDSIWAARRRRFSPPLPVTGGHAFLVAREGRDARTFIPVIEAGLNQSGEGGRVVRHLPGRWIRAGGFMREYFARLTKP